MPTKSRRRLICRLYDAIPRCWRGFDDADLERLYVAYRIRIRRDATYALVALAAAFSVEGLVLCAVRVNPSTVPVLVRSAIGAAVAVAVVPLTHRLHHHLATTARRNRIELVLPYVAWTCLAIEVLVDVWAASSVGPTTETAATGTGTGGRCGDLAWMFVVVFAAFVALPAPVWLSVALAFVTIAVYHVENWIFDARQQPSSPPQPVVDIVSSNV